MNNKTALDFYNRLSERHLAAVVASGRYLITSPFYPRKLARDIVRKLHLKKTDTLLDLGCNVGYYHRTLAPAVHSLIGVDGGQAVVERARSGNRRENVSYLCFDIAREWPRALVPDKVDKILIYSVIHFFDDIALVERLLSQCASHLRDGGAIMIGEVRTKEKYDRFLESQKNKKRRTLRDLKFAVARKIQNLYVGPSSHHPAHSYSLKELAAVCGAQGFSMECLDQQKFHPFHNTCVDLILRRK